MHWSLYISPFLRRTCEYPSHLERLNLLSSLKTTLDQSWKFQFWNFFAHSNHRNFIFSDRRGFFAGFLLQISLSWSLLRIFSALIFIPVLSCKSLIKMLAVSNLFFEPVWNNILSSRIVVFCTLPDPLHRSLWLDC